MYHMILKPMTDDPIVRAYVVGVALGDGNLSNPNGRCTRLRITCDLKYPKLIEKIRVNLQQLFPFSAVSVHPTPQNAVNVSCYSNQLESLLEWKASGGSKFDQAVRVPSWIRENSDYQIPCIRGLVETDGCIYVDRGYCMVQFVSIIENLAVDYFAMLQNLGFAPRFYTLGNLHSKYGYNYQTLYHIRLAKDTARFIDLIKPEKS